MGIGVMLVMAGLLLAWVGDKLELPSVVIVPLAIILILIGFVALVAASA